MKNRKHVMLTSLVTILVVAALAALYMLTQNGKNPAKADIQPPERPPVKVKVIEVVPDEISDRILLSGDLKPWKNVRLATDVAGIIEAVLVKEGERVEVGQNLFRIDVRSLQARLEEVKAQLTLARRTYDRYRPLSETGSISKERWDKVVADLETAKAAYEMALVELNRGTVKAPVDGIVNSVPVESGEFVARGDHLADLVQVKRLKAEIAIPERYVADIGIGTTVNMKVDPYEDKIFPGKVIHVSLVADERTRTFLSKIEVDNTKGLLKSGMIVKAEIIRANMKDTIVVPLSCLIEKDRKKSVYVVKEGKAVLRQVQLGVIEGPSAQVLEGLSFGEQLVVVGQQMLAPGATVTIEN